MCGCTEKALFPSIKIPTVGPAEEEPGVLLRQHPAPPARHLLRVTKELVGTDVESIPKGMQMVIVSFCCRCLFFFSSKIQKQPPHPPAPVAPSRAPPAARLSSCPQQLSAPDGSLSFCFWFFFFCRRDRECNDLKTNNPPTTQSLVPKSLEGIPQSVLARP